MPCSQVTGSYRRVLLATMAFVPRRGWAAIAPLSLRVASPRASLPGLHLPRLAASLLRGYSSLTTNSLQLIRSVYAAMGDAVKQALASTADDVWRQIDSDDGQQEPERHQLHTFQHR